MIVVGQGLAGSVLALDLLMNGYRVTVIDEPTASACSRVAAGIWNPVVFKRLTNSWLADEIIPELLAFYNKASGLLGVQLIRHRAILKPFTEAQEQALWAKKAASHSYLDPIIRHDLAISFRETIPSYGRVLQAGNLDVPAFLEATRHYLENRGLYLRERFDHSVLQHHDHRVQYKHLRATRIVFCEGHLVKDNPFFGSIPLKPAKGEVLTVRCEGLLIDNDILNKGIFIMPLGKDLYKVGATYEWDDRSDTPTAPAREVLSDKLQSLIGVPFQIVAHEAGVRPSVTDRRPVVGVHPHYKQYYIFNGFGTKAVMLAPFFSTQLCRNFQSGTGLHPEVNPARFLKDEHL